MYVPFLDHAVFDLLTTFPQSSPSTTAAFTMPH
jgi:hypothetical protein